MAKSIDYQLQEQRNALDRQKLAANTDNESNAELNAKANDPEQIQHNTHRPKSTTDHINASKQATVSTVTKEKQNKHNANKKLNNKLFAVMMMYLAAMLQHSINQETPKFKKTMKLAGLMGLIKFLKNKHKQRSQKAHNRVRNSDYSNSFEQEFERQFQSHEQFLREQFSQGDPETIQASYNELKKEKEENGEEFVLTEDEFKQEVKKYCDECDALEKSGQNDVFSYQGLMQRIHTVNDEKLGKQTEQQLSIDQAHDNEYKQRYDALTNEQKQNLNEQLFDYLQPGNQDVFKQLFEKINEEDLALTYEELKVLIKDYCHKCEATESKQAHSFTLDGLVNEIVIENDKKFALENEQNDLDFNDDFEEKHVEKTALPIAEQNKQALIDENQKRQSSESEQSNSIPTIKAKKEPQPAKVEKRTTTHEAQKNDEMGDRKENPFNEQVNTLAKLPDVTNTYRQQMTEMSKDELIKEVTTKEPVNDLNSNGGADKVNHEEKFATSRSGISK